jgi:ElaB/YqjD/DUF883 family membrane-anchored ribosome-binding protein
VPESRELAAGPQNARDDRSDAEPRDEQQEIARLETEIALRRERVGASFQELRRRVQVATSWRHWAGSHPLGWIGVGVSLGFVIGCLAGRRSRAEL